MKPMNYSLIRIIFAIILGLVLVLWPAAASDYLVITIGVLFIIPGLIGIIGYFSGGKEAVARHFPIAYLGSLLFGAWLVIMLDFFAGVLMYLLGFIMMLGGIQQIYSLVVARRWTAVPAGFYIVPVLILLAGLLILLDPLAARDTAFIIIGITSIVYATTELFNWFRFTNRKPKAPHNKDVEDAKIVED